MLRALFFLEFRQIVIRKVNVINQKLNDLREILDKNDNNDEPEEEIEVQNIFPISNVGKLDTLENFLGNKQNFKLLVRSVKPKN